jgi:hypothetical protein
MEASMSRKSWLHPLLGIAALAAWLLFILACTGWPSWSPDGNKVLASYFDPTAKQEGIALYDLKAHSARSIFAHPSPGPGDADRNPVYAQWESDGRRAIVLWPDQAESLQVTLLPLDSGQARHYFLRDRKGELPILPYPEVAGFLFIGGKQISRLDLATGDALSVPPSVPVGGGLPAQGADLDQSDTEVYLHTDGTRIFYDREAKSEDALEVGTVDAQDLSLRPLFKLRRADLEAQGLPGLQFGTFVTPEPRDSRIAILAGSKSGDAILLCSQAGLEKVLKPDLGVHGARMGVPQWAPGGELLYVPVAAIVEGKDAQYWVAEVPLAGGPVRLTPIARFKAEDSDWDADFRLALQVSLSPDGSTLATTTAGLSAKLTLPETPRALYLVDLRDPGRTVTSIPAPVAATAANATKVQP